MRLFLLSLLAVGSVQSHAIGSIGSGLWAYSPARGEFPVQSSLAKGYLRYIDGTGTQRLESYWYPEPLHGVRQHVVADAEQPQRQQFLRLESAGVSQAREEYFRAWCEQRLRDIQAEVDRLRASGVAPPQDMIEQLKPLQKILSASTAAVSETAEVQRAKDEHLNIWNEARLRAIYAQQLQPLVVPSFQLRSTAVDTKDTPQLNVGKLIRDEKVENAEPVIRTEPQAVFPAAQVKLSPSGVVVDTPEVIQAREEHFRLYNEAKLRGEKAGNDNEDTKKAVETPIVQTEVKQSALEKVEAQETPANVKSATHPSTAESSSIQEHPLGVPLHQLAVSLRSVAGFDAPTEQQLRVVQETPEVQRAREEHLKLKKAQEEAIASQSQAEKTKQTVLGVVAPATRAQEATNLKAQQSVIAQNIPPVILHTLSQSSDPSAVDIGLRSDGVSAQVIMVNQLGQVEETPEVKRAREEHLRLVEEARLRAMQYQTIDSVKPENTKTVDSAEIAVSAEKQQRTEDQSKEEARLEAERIREEERLREEQRMRDAKLLEEEQRTLEAELLKLRQEEEERKESERRAEEQRLKEEELLLKAAEKAEQVEKQNQKNAEIIAEIRADIHHTPAIQSGFTHNPYLVHYSSPQGTNYLLAEQRPVAKQSAAAVRYYFPASTGSSKVVFKDANPFLQRYTLDSAKVNAPQAQVLLDERQVVGVNLPEIDNQQQPVQSTEQALSELERATREHFRAHEIALEQLRLAKLRNAEYKDCN